MLSRVFSGFIVILNYLFNYIFYLSLSSLEEMRNLNPTNTHP